MSKTFIIAEAACTWLHGGLEAAYRSIRAAKESGADAFKVQWTSDPLEMGKRRGVDGEKYRRLAWDPAWHPLLKAKCEEVGIEYMCTVFIPKDIHGIAPYVSRFKVSAFEGTDEEFLEAHRAYMTLEKTIITSINSGKRYPRFTSLYLVPIYCVSKYPTPIEELRLELMQGCHGLSDHTTSVLSGAVAVGAGARIIEKHVRLSDTPRDDPDYGHSLVLDQEHCFYCSPDRWCKSCSEDGGSFAEYVSNIRTAERMI